jgi:hypothetical protein
MTGSYGPFSSEIWFPVQAGTTALPDAPEPIVNVDWLPANAAEIPVDWVPGDVEALFQDILPNQEAPVYALAIDPSGVIKPYREVFLVDAVLRVGLEVQSVPYALTLETRQVTLPVKAKLGEARTFPDKIAVLLKIQSFASSVLRPYRQFFAAVKTNLTVSSSGVTAPTTILLHMDDVEGSTNFVDEMGAIWTSQFASISSSQSKIGASVGDFTTPTAFIGASEPRLKIGSNDFTVDFWMKPAGFRYEEQYLYSTGFDPGVMSADYGLYLYYTTLRIVFRNNTSSTSSSLYSVGNIPDVAQWNHIALCKKGENIFCYVNGELPGGSSYVGSASLHGNENWTIGNSRVNQHFAGYIDEFRVVIGVGLYSGNFTPPSDPYDPGPSLKLKLAQLITRTKVTGEFAYVNRFSQVLLKVSLGVFFTTGSNFKPNAYTGNGSGRTVDGLGFRPSFVWIKPSSYDEYGVFAFDRLRGSNKAAHFNQSYNEEAFGSTSLTAFTQDGFTLGSSPIVNRSGYNFCAWVFGGNQATQSISRQVVSDGFIGETLMATVEPEAISYGYYKPNNTASGGANRGTYVYHGFSSEPDVVFVTTGTGTASMFGCRLVGKVIGDSSFSSAVSDQEVQVPSITQPIYQWNPARPNYFRAGQNLDLGTNGRYIYYAFKAKDKVVAISKYAGSAVNDIRVNLGWRPAMIMIKQLYASDGYSGFPLLTFDATRSWDTAVSWSRYSNELATTGPIVDATGFTIPKNSTISSSGSLFMYVAVAGNLVSPLQFSSASPDSTVISATAHTPAVQLIVGVALSVPATSVDLQSSEPAVQITSGASVDIPAREISVTVSIPEINPNTTLDIPPVDSVVTAWIPDYVGELTTSIAVPSSDSSLTAHVPAVSIITPTSNLYLFPFDPLYLFDQYE